MFFFKQKTEYEMRISDWSSDVCSSDLEIAPTEKRVRVQFAGETVADSTRPLLLLEQGHTPVYYFPRDDVRTKLLPPSGRSPHCPFTGDARYCSVPAGERTAADDRPEEQRAGEESLRIRWIRGASIQ